MISTEFSVSVLTNAVFCYNIGGLYGAADAETAEAAGRTLIETGSTRRVTACHVSDMQRRNKKVRTFKHVSLSMILDRKIKKFERRKPVKGTHRTVVGSI